MDDIVHIIEIPNLHPIAKYLNILSRQKLMEPPTDKRQEIILDPHARTVHICHSKNTGGDPIHTVVANMIHLPRPLAHPIIIQGCEQMVLVNREVFWAAIYLARPRKDNADPRVVLPAYFQEFQLPN